MGGESTRPMATPVSLEQELERTIPVIERIRKQSPEVMMSIDTFKAKVAEEAVKAGAVIVNDISGGIADAKMLGTVAELGVPYILMHMRGTPHTMRSAENTAYGNVVRDVHDSLLARVSLAEEAGISRWNLILDPGVGFAFKTRHNLEVVGGLSQLRPLNLPVLVGPSKKGFLGELLKEKDLLFGDEKTNADSTARQWATAGIVSACAAHKADIVRVHDLPAMAQLLGIVDSVVRRKSL